MIFSIILGFGGLCISPMPALFHRYANNSIYEYKSWFLSLVLSESVLSGNSGSHQAEVKRPFGGVYGRSYQVGKRSLDQDFEIAHATSKRPFGRIFGNSYKLGKREYELPESHFTVTRHFKGFNGNHISSVPVSEHKQSKRPFGSIYGNSLSKRPFGSVYGSSYGKRPFGSVYGASYSKRPFGGVFGSSYKIGKRFAYPVEVHNAMKRPFGKVYGRSYKFGKRPFGQMYGTKYGKRSSEGYIVLSMEDAYPLQEKLDENIGFLPSAKRPFGKMYGKREYAEKRPFGQIYSTRPFGKRLMHGDVNFPILSKRPFGRVYGRSYKEKKIPLKIDKVERVNPAMLDLDEYGPFARPVDTFDPDTGDLVQSHVYLGADGYGMSISGFDNGDKAQYGELYTDSGDGAMETGQTEDDQRDFGLEDDNNEEFEDSEEE